MAKGFITWGAAHGILSTHGVTSTRQASQLMGSVFTRIYDSNEKRYLFDEFVDIFSHDAAYKDLVRRLRREGEL